MSNTTSVNTLTEPTFDGTAVEMASCNYCRCRFVASTLVKVKRGRYDSGSPDMLCPRCSGRTTVECTHCGERVYTQNTATLVGGGGRICETCRFSPAFSTCSRCNVCDVAENMTNQSGYSYCPTCLVLEGNFDFGDFKSADSYPTRLRSRRCFGVEIETDECDGYYEALVDHPAWGVKEDCTVDGKEFYSAILDGDAGLDAVDEIADVAYDNNWEAGVNCGLHLHLDMRGEKRDSLYAIAYAYRATEKVWLSFASRARRDGSYCHSCEWTCDDVDRAVAARNGLGTRFHRWADTCGRYNWINVQAFGSYHTFENRLHDGTCDGRAMVNWIKANTRFADWASKLGYEGVKAALSGLSADEMFTFIAQEIWDDDDLALYYGARAKNMRGTYLTTSVGRPGPNAAVDAAVAARTHAHTWGDVI